MHQIQLSTNYPGGNIIFNNRRGSTVFIEQDLRDTCVWWFYWNFAAEVSDAPCTFTFSFTNGEVVGPYGPAVSFDGIHYEWAPKECLVDSASFRYTFKESNRKVFFFVLNPLPHDAF